MGCNSEAVGKRRDQMRGGYGSRKEDKDDEEEKFL